MSHDRPRSIVRGVLLSVLALVVVTACGGPARTTPEIAPDFALADLDGKTVRLSDSAGKVRLVDFWATWCPPCREEIPAFKELYAAYKDHGFEIIAISMDEEGAKIVRPFVEKERIPYTNLIGTEEVENAFGGVFGYPTAFLLDREGKIVDSYVGGVPKRVFESRIREILGLGAAS